MTSFSRISSAEAAAIMAERESLLIDIRDEQSYQAGHIENAVHIDNSNIGQFIADSHTDLPLIVYCYHGNSSQSASAYLSEQGFSEVYSIDGGFEGWAAQYPIAQIKNEV
jgi:thiosulfate sulfurtransferase